MTEEDSLISLHDLTHLGAVCISSNQNVVAIAPVLICANRIIVISWWSTVTVTANVSWVDASNRPTYWYVLSIAWPRTLGSYGTGFPESDASTLR